MKLQSAYCLKLKIPTKEFENTIQTFISACNYISTYAWKEKVFSRNELHALLYEKVRENFGLKSQLTCNALKHVSSKYKSAFKNKHKLKTAICFRKQTMVLQIGKDFSYAKNGDLSITTLKNRCKGVKFHEYQNPYHNDETWIKGGAQISIRDGSVYLHQTSHKEIEQTLKNHNVIGIDVGVNQNLVASNGSNFNTFSGNSINQKTKYKLKRSSLTKKRKKAHQCTRTRSVRRHLKRLSSRERRFVKNQNHIISKELVKQATKKDISVISMEKLTNIRKSSKILSKNLHGCSFFELQSFVKYKAERNGIKVIFVNPAYSSQTCSKCGCVKKQNRNGNQFKCIKCGYELHADLNASRIVRKRGLKLLQKSLKGTTLINAGLSVNQPECGALSHQRPEAFQLHGSSLGFSTRGN